MVRHPASVLRFAWWVVLLGMTMGPNRPARAQGADPASAEEARERRAMERYVSLLEKNPRRGTALDRVYGYHVERGTLDDLIKSYRDRLVRKSDDGAAALILGLLEFQRGQDAAAVAALRQAETARPEDPLPSYYLGQALVMVGQPEQAAEAFERAIERKPARNDLLEIFQALGRVYQRTQKAEQALAVWSRLEALFPDDPRVQEQIATTLAEEGQPAQALPRFEALATKVRDPFRQVQLAMQAAELKVRLNRSPEALKDFEAMLAKLRPDSWLHKEVRRKIEEVFLRNDDRAGLVTYYERWTKRDPEDVEALVRLARTLATMGRVAEAQPWYEKAIKLAPGRRDLRLALIGQLAQDQKYAEAAAQYELLDRAEPGNPDTLKDWGNLVLHDPTRSQEQRKAAASAIWRKLLEAKPNDAVTTAQVADLLRQAEMADDAMALYRKAIEQSPGNPQYREYLGEYLHRLKRPAEAIAEWSKIAEGAGKNARNLGRLAEILASFGYLKEAIAPLKEAIELEKDDFDLRMKLAEYDHRLGQFDDAEAQLAAASRLAQRDEQRSAVRESRVANDQAAGRLSARVAAIRQDLDAHPDAPAGRWLELARYLETDGKLPDAVRATDRAIAIDGRSIPSWALAARVRESAGNLGDAADALRRLGEIDRRNRAEYLTGIARLQSRLGRVEEAIKAGRELLAATSASPEHSEFFAQLCFQHGRLEEGLDALRRAVRANPRDTKAVLTLAETLAGQYQTEEAIEMYWRAFDRAEGLDNKLDVVRKLTELYLQRNQLDRLLGRLQHQEREDRPGGNTPSASQGRDVSMCLAQAYASSGDIGAARAELERLLAANNRDTQLLAQLSKLAEEEGDVESAARFQKQLVDLAPSDEGVSRLGQLFARSGDLEEAQGVWSKLAAGQGSALHVTMAMDSLLFHQKPMPVLETTEAMLRKDPHDWEALYRRGVAAAQLDRPDQAAEAFRALLDVRISDDEKSALAKAQARNPHLQPPNSYPMSLRMQGNSPMENRLGVVVLIRYFCRLDDSTISQRYSWSPGDFGQARLAAMGWMVGLAQRRGAQPLEDFLTSIREPAEKRPADPRALWDRLYLCSMRLDYPGSYAAARELSRAAPSDPLALWAYLHSLGNRQTSVGQRAVITQIGNVESNLPQLDRAELDHVLACFRGLQSRRPELAQAEILQYVDDELKRAKRVEEEERFYRELVAGASRIGQVAAALNIAARRGDVDGLVELAERYERLQAGRSSTAFSSGSFTFAGGPSLSMSQGMSACADRKAYTDVLRLLDLNLAATRRKMERQSTGAAGRAWRARSSSVAALGARMAQRIWVGSSYRSVAIDFPRPNEYFDSDLILVLRTAFELYKRDDLMSDLVAHFRRQADAASSPVEANYPRLALSAILWWSDSKEEAIAELNRVVEASRAESDLRLDLAELMERQADYSGALSMVDAVQPLDNFSLRRREELALRVAVRTGNIDRARQAAERLFGLRLDTDVQVALSGQMHQLGLHELAEALLGRARRRAGNKASALVGLMLQYQRQDKLDQAVQVAMQILRATPAAPTSAASLGIRVVDDPVAARSAATGVLARSGRLAQLIDRANEELKKTPNAVQIHQSLADYYAAARQPDRARGELIKVVDLRPDDVNLRLQIANQLAQEGQAAAAVAQYKAAFKKDLVLLERVSLNLLAETFRKAGKLDDLLQILGGGEIPSSISPYRVFTMIQELMADDRLHDRALAILRKFWRANPTYQASLLSYVTREEIWQLPEIYDAVRESILAPDTGSNTPYAQWLPFRSFRTAVVVGGQVVQSQSMASVTGRFLDVAAARGRLDDLARDIASGRKARPGWTAGDVYLAMVYSRSGRFDEARSLIRRLADPKVKDETLMSSIYPMYAYLALGAELEAHPALADEASAIYERAASLPFALVSLRDGIDQHPAGRLIAIYERQGQLEEARRLILNLSRQDVPASLSEDLARQYRAFAFAELASRLVELGYSADALPLYSEGLALAEQVNPENALAALERQQYPRRLREGLESVLRDLGPEGLASIAGRSIAEAATEPARASAKVDPDAPKARARDQALDLVMLIYPRSLDKARVRCLLAESLAARDARQLAALDEPLERLRRVHPEDLSVAIVEALRALASGESVRINPALERLDRLVERTPLEPLPPGGRANARQRAEAARQVPLWLVARACEKGPEASSRRAIAGRLSARALEAARRQTDNLILLAMVREQGEHALASGDRKGAEAAWGRMLDLVMPAPSARARRPRPAPSGSGQASEKKVEPRKRATGGGTGALP